jgi:hypothetical protein
MRKTITTGVVTLMLMLVIGIPLIWAAAHQPDEDCTFEVGPIEGRDEPANAILRVELDEEELKLELTGATPNTLYTGWWNFVSKPEDAQGVAPTAATTAAFTAGMGTDINGFFTDEEGNGTLNVDLDYNPLQPLQTPVVYMDLSQQGMNNVDGHWMRVYDEDITVMGSVQVIDPNTGLPMVVRGTAAGVLLARHPDTVTHGHTPGTGGGVDFTTTFRAPFPAECLPQ